jgi:hypothetical protein
MEEYLTTFKYRTRNYVKHYHMKLTQPDPDSDRIERVFKGYQEEKKNIMQWVSEEIKNSERRKEDL